MDLIIDNRETKIKEYFKDCSYVKFKNLEMGDIQFHKDGKILLVIERKTLPDLASSIKSGRYREQKMRLVDNCDINTNQILYLIEGHLKKTDNIDKIPYSTFIGSYINLFMRDDLKMIQTSGIDETIFFIEMICKKITNKDINFDKLLKNNCDDNATIEQINQTNQSEYLNTLKGEKKKNITPINCCILQLSQIPTISIGIATEICKSYKSIFELCKLFETNGENALKEIKYGTTTGKQIRIGDKRSKTIYSHLFAIECTENEVSVKPTKEKKTKATKAKQIVSEVKEVKVKVKETKAKAMKVKETKTKTKTWKPIKPTIDECLID
jgi:ERCC4-type nuclease